MPPAFGIAFGLVKAMTGRKAFLLGLHESQGDWLGFHVHLDPQNVIDLPARPTPRFSVDDLDRSRCLFTPDKVLRPSPFVNYRIDEFCPGVGFVEAHDRSGSDD